MHKNKIIHRDFKSQNIFKHNDIYKIGDLGFCKIFEKKIDLATTPLGSIGTMAPEILSKRPYGLKVQCDLPRLICGHWG